MNFSVLPPEINSLRIFAGTGSGPMLAAAAAWDGLADELSTAAAAVSSVTSGLTGGSWPGPAGGGGAPGAAGGAGWGAGVRVARGGWGFWGGWGGRGGWGAPAPGGGGAPRGRSLCGLAGFSGRPRR